MLTNTHFDDAVSRIDHNATQGADTTIEWRGYRFRVAPRKNGDLRVLKYRHDWIIPDETLLGTFTNSEDAVYAIYRNA